MGMGGYTKHIETALKLVEMPKKAPETKPVLSLQADAIDEAYQVQDQIKNIVILAHMDNGEIKIFQGLDPNVDMLAFMDVVKMRCLQATNDYLSVGAPGPVIA